MKKTLLIAFALMLSAATFAQQQLATLNHNDEITVYYGQSALQSAHAAAVNGDIITLSPGTFNSVNITKAVTIRGAGMFPDTAAGTEPTTLINDYTITVNQDSVYSLYMEGIYHASSNVKYEKVYNPQFVKCYFKNIKENNESNSSSSVLYDATFINCIIEYFQSGYSRNCAKNPQFVNSVILDLDSRNPNNIILTNCVANVAKNYTFLNATIVTNSIIYGAAQYNNGVNAYSSYYSIGIQTSTYSSADNFFNYSGLADHHLYNYRGMNTVFKNFTGSYSPGITFEMLDEVAATRLGDDGTQIGVYGGVMPFDPKVRNPLIKKCNVAKKSTVDGKLAVDIEVVSE